MSRTVSFKVYMTKADDKSVKEVRRFGIEVDVVTSFMYLREKIQTIFPALRGKHFSISWKDEDEDDVTISSDEELIIAINETAKDDIRKLYVLLHSEYATQSDQGPIHVGITCDGCDSQVRGFRYKCIQCPDYDLCVECEGRGMHPEHCMIRMSVPLQWTPNMGKRLAHNVNKFVKRTQSCKTTEDDEKRCRYRHGKHHGKSRHGVEGPSWLDTFATYLDEWANLPGECPAKEATKNDEAKKKTNEQSTGGSASASSFDKFKIPKTNEEPTVGSASAPLFDNITFPQTNEKCPAEQLLMNVGLVVGENFISQFLDPLLNMHNSAGKTGNPTSTASTSTSSSLASTEEPKPTTNDGAAPARKFSGKGETLRQPTKNDEHSSRDDSKESAERTIPESELGWTILNKTDSPLAIPSSGVAPSTGAVPKQAQPSAQSEASSKPIYPPLPVKQPTEEKEHHIVHHQNPAIQNAVERMIQMGFSNSGGWLTNLLVSKGGDIAAALDALAPVQR